MEDVTLKLPLSGKEVVIKSYASYKVTSEIQRIINAGTHVTGTGDVDENGATDRKMKANLVMDSNSRLDADKRTIELMVMSFDGSSENVYDRLSDEREGDVNFVINEINKVTEASKVKPAEKKS